MPPCLLRGVNLDPQQQARFFLGLWRGETGRVGIIGGIFFLLLFCFARSLGGHEEGLALHVWPTCATVVEKKTVRSKSLASEAPLTGL